VRKNRERDSEIYRLRKEEGYTTSKLAEMFQLTRARISRIIEEIEHERKRLNNSVFLSELPLRMQVVLRNRLGDERKATAENVAALDPIELDKARNLGKITLKQTKDILLKYNVQHLMHKNWSRL
jgi:DNA-directed RNA polymerase alpha subunit